MLTLELPATDNADAVELQLEHSLVSISKWEAFYEKAFFTMDSRTHEESMRYVEYMVLGDIPKDCTKRLSPEHIETISEYINSTQSATWFTERPQSPGLSKEVITSELIYYWLVQFRIPFQPTETWHLSRLMILVKIAGIKQTQPKPMSKQEQAEQYRKLNEQRRRELGTSG